jgi:hypothetical protein
MANIEFLSISFHGFRFASSVVFLDLTPYGEFAFQAHTHIHPQAIACGIKIGIE